MIPNIIDIEASGFGSTSYPIEIGIVLSTNEKYCSLIKPAPGWIHWSDQAEETHHISRDLLQQRGKPVIQVATELNEFLGNTSVYCDGWVVDKPWLIELFTAARINNSFTISALEFILNEQQMENWHKTKDQIIEELSLIRHRASTDAFIIQETYRRTLLCSKTY